ncbi:MAG: hypothetical protein LBR21_06000 [Propionibacteriaceae bacterium]|jgi:predicted metal-dependent peptidase|nr:hypothetical protein [Propionibacteriaceae bacterium]
MARQKAKASPAQAARELAWVRIKNHPALYHLAYCLAARSPEPTPGDGGPWARLAFGGKPTQMWFQIRVNPARLAAPEEWEWVFAHLLLHLGLNHYDPATTGRLARDTEHFQAACGEANSLLAALRVGRAPSELTGLGAAGMDEDILGPILDWGDRYNLRYSREHSDALATGLANAVHRAVKQAAGVEEDQSGKVKHSWDRAMSWFISSYPLLGGLAAGFKIVADADLCSRCDISIAAVDPALAEIYVNPRAPLGQYEWRFVLAHEMLHAALRHGERAMGRDPYLWNIAADYVINGWLVEMEVGELPFGLLHDLELQGLSVEAVYDRIANDLRRLRKLATLRGKGLGDILGEPLPGAGENRRGIDLDEFYRRALTSGLTYHDSAHRGLIPAGLREAIQVLDQPPMAWDVALARWFEDHVRSPEPIRSYGHPSRRQASAPDIPRPGRYYPEGMELTCTFGVVLDTSGSMSGKLLGKALGAIAAYARAKDVHSARLVYCDAAPHDAGYVPVESIVDKVTVTGRGGTVLQLAIRFLERTPDFPADGPILIITDGWCDNLTVKREHAYLIPAKGKLPFPPHGPVFRVV